MAVRPGLLLDGPREVQQLAPSGVHDSGAVGVVVIVSLFETMPLRTILIRASVLAVILGGLVLGLIVNRLTEVVDGRGLVGQGLGEGLSVGVKGAAGVIDHQAGLGLIGVTIPIIDQHGPGLTVPPAPHLEEAQELDHAKADLKIERGLADY
jgi:hypothetical protein